MTHALVSGLGVKIEIAESWLPASSSLPRSYLKVLSQQLSRRSRSLLQRFAATYVFGGLDQRGLDLLCPVWHLLDLTPEGREDWYAQLEYEAGPVGARG